MWILKHGNEAENIEAMKASFQKIPEHLKNPVKPPNHLNILVRLYWELATERNYYSTGLSQMIPVSKIKERVMEYGFEDYQLEELVEIIRKMDKTYVDWDEARIKATRERLQKAR